MTAAVALTQKIRGAIPLSESMQFSIDSLSQEAIRVSAPLQPNINIHGTGFAGSIYSLAVLTGWALCTHIMDELAMDGDLVVGKAEISYRAPVKADLECHCQATAEQRQSFLAGWRWKLRLANCRRPSSRQPSSPSPVPTRASLHISPAVPRDDLTAFGAPLR